MDNGRSRYRTLIEWSLSMVALTIVVLAMLAIDSPVRQYAGNITANITSDGARLRVPEPVVHVARTAWRICMDHQPLAAFAGVASVLVLFMRRMR
jgi:hypothetical protein